MRYAIDRYQLGKEKEVCADSFYDTYIANRRDRFFCPECGEKVYWRKKGGSKPNEFYHQTKTGQTPECDKRVDGKSGLCVYERVGLPLYLIKNNNQYSLNMMFPALGETLMSKAIMQNAKASITVRGESRCISINEMNFFASKPSLIQINFIPKADMNYKLDFYPQELSSEIQKKWSNYADGFCHSGAFFTCEISGGKKVRKGDSISLGKEYLLVAKQFIPQYSEINIKEVGNILLDDQYYSVYRVIIEISVDDTLRFKSISGYLQRNFGIGLLEIAPSLIPLWPPLMNQDYLIPVKKTDTVYCAIQSGNSQPRVYQYQGSNVESLAVEENQPGLFSVDIPIGSSETITSVDRKYVGREIIIKNEMLPDTASNYEIALMDDEKKEYSWENLTSQDLTTAGFFVSNAKMEIYFGSTDKTYLHVPIRKAYTQLPNRNHSECLFATVEGATIFELKPSKEEYPAENNEMIIVLALKKGEYGRMVDAPIWIKSIFRACEKKHFRYLKKYLKDHILNGKMQSGLLIELMKFNRVIKQ